MEITVTMKFTGPDAMEQAVQYLMRDKVEPGPIEVKIPAEAPPAPEEKPTKKRSKVAVKPAELHPAEAPPVPPAPAKTQADAQKALEAVFNAKGMGTARDLLSRYGVNRLTDMKADLYGEFVAHADRVLAGQEV